ncbi:MAG: ATP-binding cassette domain-containing protein [Eubacteriales bacterium]
MLELKNVSLKIGQDRFEVLKDINLKMDTKKMYVLTGPNGGGKSSLAKLMMGIEKPTTGQVLLDGEDITGLSVTERAKIGIGYAFQHPPRFKGIQVKEMLKLAMSETSASMRDLLLQVGLCARDYITRDLDATLSGGEIKRIEIATILARKLNLAVFDEPEAGIDLWSFQKLAQTFKTMHSKLDTTIVIISHQERILELADEIILVENGHITENVSMESILNRQDTTMGCDCYDEQEVELDAERVG